MNSIRSNLQQTCSIEARLTNHWQTNHQVAAIFTAKLPRIWDISRLEQK